MPSALTTVIARIALSVIFTVGYFWVLYLFITGRAAIAADSKDVVVVVIGALTAGVGLILNYWFSSSQGSALKTELLARSPSIEDDTSTQRGQG